MANLWTLSAVVALPANMQPEDSADVPGLLLHGVPQFALVQQGYEDEFANLGADRSSWDDDFDPTGAGWSGRLAPAELWVLFIEDRHGSGATLYRTEEGATQALTEWVDEWWGQELPDRAKPTDPTLAIQEYFELVDDEWFSIEKAKVNN